MTLAIRLVAMTLTLIGVYAMVQAVRQWLLYGKMSIEYEQGFNWAGHAIGYLMTGLGLAFFSEPLVRWIVPARRDECPQCGYWLKNLKPKRCPECGLQLTPSGDAPASSSN